jgi:hypothetical protein
MGDDAWMRASDGDICFDVVKSRGGRLAIYLACRRSGAGLPPNQYRPALFDTQRRRHGRWSGASGSHSSLQDDPNSIEISSSVHRIVGIPDEGGRPLIRRPGDEIAFVGVERLDPTGLGPPGAPARSASEPIASPRLDRSDSRYPILHPDP